MLSYPEKIFGFLNGIYLILILLLFINSASILALLGTTLGILIGFIIFVLPFLIGIVFSLKHLIKKTKGLSLTEKAFVAFPLINLLIIIGFIIFLQTLA